MASSDGGGPWKEIKAPVKPKVVSRTTRTGTYSADFVAGGIKASSPTYQRSNSVGRFSTTTTLFDDGSQKVRTEKTNRRHTHFNTDGTVHTASHVPTSGSTIQDRVRAGATRVYDKKK